LKKTKQLTREGHFTNYANKLMLQIGLTLTLRYASSSTVVEIFFYALSCRKEWPKITTKQLKSKNIPA